MILVPAGWGLGIADAAKVGWLRCHLMRSTSFSSAIDTPLPSISNCLIQADRQMTRSRLSGSSIIAIRNDAERGLL